MLACLNLDGNDPGEKEKLMMWKIEGIIGGQKFFSKMTSIQVTCGTVGDLKEQERRQSICTPTQVG